MSNKLLNNAAANAGNNAANAGINAGINAAKSTANAAAKTVLSTKDKIFIGFLVVIGIFAILGLVAFSMQQVNDGRVNAMNNRVTQQEEENKKLSAQSNSASSIAATNMKRGDQGPPGIQGPPGPTGGVHAGAGPLLCVGQRKVATPTVGKSSVSIIYLDDRRYTPIQYWTMRNNPDGTVSVVNKFTGNCMTSNNLGDVFSDTCQTPVPLTQKFNWGPNMQLTSADRVGYCVAVDNQLFKMDDSNSMNKYDLDNMTEKPGSNKGTVSQLKLLQCGPSPNQTWWIGN